MLKYNFYNKVQKTFINLAKKNKDKYYILNSSANNTNLEKKILNIVLKKIKS